MGRPWNAGNSRDKILGVAWWRCWRSESESPSSPLSCYEIVACSLFLLSFLVHASYSSAAKLVKRWMFSINGARDWDVSKRDVKARRPEISGASSTLCSKTKGLTFSACMREARNLPGR